MTIKLQYRYQQGYDGDCDKLGLHIVNSTIDLGTYYFKNIIDLQETVENVTKNKWNYIKLWVYDDVNNSREICVTSFKNIEYEEYKNGNNDNDNINIIHQPNVINLYKYNTVIGTLVLRELQEIELSFCM